MKIVYLSSRKDLKWFVKRLPKVLHFEESEKGIKIITKGGVYMVKFKGEKKVGIGEWIQTHKGGQHIEDFEFSGVFIGMDLEAFKKYDDDGNETLIDVAYFVGIDGKVYKTSVWQITGYLKRRIIDGTLNRFDAVSIKYGGLVPSKKDKKIKVHNYKITIYDYKENEKEINELLKNSEEYREIPDIFGTRWDVNIEKLQGKTDEPPF